MTNSCSFSSSQHVLISSSFLIFSAYRILSWRFFSFSTWKMLCHFLWLPWFLMRNLTSFNFFFPHYREVFISLAAFKIFSLSSVFRSLTTVYLDMDFFSFFFFFDMDFFGLSCLGFYQLLESISLCPCHICKILTIFIWVFFKAPLYSSSTFETAMT